MLVSCQRHIYTCQKQLAKMGMADQQPSMQYCIAKVRAEKMQAFHISVSIGIAIYMQGLGLCCPQNDDYTGNWLSAIRHTVEACALNDISEQVAH